MKPKICIIGGGIGGLITSYLLYEKLSDKINVTIFDCNKRIGGKIYTRILPKTGARIETGMAEVYDYSQLGDDTLKNLILKFGLKIIPMHGDLVFFKGHCLSSDEDIKNIFGPKTLSLALRTLLDSFSRRSSFISFYSRHSRPSTQANLLNLLYE
jgi:protoporphyrinogen oxidase